MAHVKSLRPHVSLGEAQQRAVQAFAEHCKASGGGGGVAAATPSEGQDGGAAAAAAEQQPAEEEPSCSCLKQKPKMKTWPSRHIRIQGKSLMVYDDEESSERAKALLGAEAERERRQTSILDLTGCEVTMGKEHFMLAVRPHNISPCRPQPHHSPLSCLCVAVAAGRLLQDDNLEAGPRAARRAGGTLLLPGRVRSQPILRCCDQPRRGEKVRPHQTRFRLLSLMWIDLDHLDVTPQPVSHVRGWYVCSWDDPVGVAAAAEAAAGGGR